MVSPGQPSSDAATRVIMNGQSNRYDNNQEHIVCSCGSHGEGLRLKSIYCLDFIIRLRSMFYWNLPH